MPRTNNLTYVLGGGEGKRLFPLTRDKAKPAVPFGGMYRIIDFALSNLYHSGIRKIYVLTQFESISLHRHIKQGWFSRFGTGGDEFLDILPARKGGIGGWYLGTADAINQNLRFIMDENPEMVNVFGADHVYLFDVSQMNDFHLKNNADLTISGVPIKRELAARNLGVLVVDESLKLLGFEEKPEEPKPIPGNEEYCLSSMGNYTFRSDVLLEELEKDGKKETADKEIVLDNPDNFSTHDFGYDVIPAMLRSDRRIFVYNFKDNVIPGDGGERIWWDVGTLDQFYEANMAITGQFPPLNLYNREWKVLTYVESTQPAKFVGSDGGSSQCLDSIMANGVVVSHGIVERSVISYNTRINGEVRESVLLGNNEIGKGTIIQRAILDKNVKVPAGEDVGINKEKDKERGFTISRGGITVVPRDYQF